MPCLYCSSTIIGIAKTTMRIWGYIDNTQLVNCDCGEPQTMAHLLCCRLLDEPCSPEDLTIVTERATACARMWQHLYLSEGHERREVQRWIGNNLCPTDWGWQYMDRSLVPLSTDRPVAPTSVLRIVSCGCKTGCRKTCGCRKAGLYCSPICRYCN